MLERVAELGEHADARQVEAVAERAVPGRLRGEAVIVPGLVIAAAWISRLFA